MSAPSQLSIYNGALLIAKARQLASLSDSGESLNELNGIWDRGFLDACLEQGWWKHAMRTVKVDYTVGAALAFGYQYGFIFPTDLVNLYQISVDERFSVPLLQYYDQGRKWFCDNPSIYIRYVSNDATNGGLVYANWPESFRHYVHAELALRAFPRLGEAKATLDDIVKIRRAALLDARAKDALKEPTKFQPEGSWNTARRGGGGNQPNNPYVA